MAVAHPRRVPLARCLGCFGLIFWQVKHSKRLTVRSPDTVASGARSFKRAPQQNPGLFGVDVGEDGTLHLAQVKLNLILATRLDLVFCASDDALLIA